MLDDQRGVTKFGKRRIRGGRGGGGGEKTNIFPDVLCEWPLTKFCRCEAAILKPLLNF